MSKLPCKIYYFSDSQECVHCGSSWDANDPYSPVCNFHQLKKVSFVTKLFACTFGTKTFTDKNNIQPFIKENSMSNFIKFRDAVNAKFASMCKQDEVFTVGVNGDKLSKVYLQAFPEGTNPIFRERTEHDCSCCKNFIRNLGKVVSIKNGKDYETVWDVDAGSETYQQVADVMAAFVRSKAIAGVYRTRETKFGEKKSFAQLEKWDHFYASVPKELQLSNGQSAADYNGSKKADFDVFKRSLEEINEEAIEIVSDLIDQNSLYRGQEHLGTVKGLQKYKKQYNKLKTDRQKEIFIWSNVVKNGHALRYKNTVIGTLMSDISEEMDLEKAVKSFESKVAPHNYKRPTALVTQKMIDDAKNKVDELNLEPALHRRFAKETDITVNNVLFADRTANLKNSVFDELKPTKTTKKPDLDKVEEVNVEEFVTKILPKAESLELFINNKHENNLVSLIAPEYLDAPNLFKWSNGFSWSYNGEVTDSIKERVKSAGGNVTGDVRVSLSWFNTDDLDIHVKEPSGNHIYYGNKKSSITSGQLDVDMNAGGRISKEPVENIFWQHKSKMCNGKYTVFVNQFSKRNTSDVGFVIETEVDGEIQTYSYEKEVRPRQNIIVLIIEVKDGNIKIIPSDKISNKNASKEVWGINTEQFHKVKLVMNSPNHWDGQTAGNKHLFFMLEDCKNPDKARGFYNEFLSDELTQHRKVFEVLSSKMKAEPTKDQLSGLGFSTTKKDSVLCKVSGSFNRVVKINF